jgi:hypothetical protein
MLYISLNYSQNFKKRSFAVQPANLTFNSSLNSSFQLTQINKDGSTAQVSIFPNMSPQQPQKKLEEVKASLVNQTSQSSIDPQYITSLIDCAKDAADIGYAYFTNTSQDVSKPLEAFTKLKSSLSNIQRMAKIQEDIKTLPSTAAVPAKPDAELSTKLGTLASELEQLLKWVKIAKDKDVLQKNPSFLTNIQTELGKLEQQSSDLEQPTELKIKMLIEEYNKIASLKAQARLKKDAIGWELQLLDISTNTMMKSTEFSKNLEALLRKIEDLKTSLRKEKKEITGITTTYQELSSQGTKLKAEADHKMEILKNLIHNGNPEGYLAKIQREFVIYGPNVSDEMQVKNEMSRIVRDIESKRFIFLEQFELHWKKIFEYFETACNEINRLGFAILKNNGVIPYETTFTYWTRDNSYAQPPFKKV